MEQQIRNLIRGRTIALLGEKTECIGIYTQLNCNELFNIQYFVSQKEIEAFRLVQEDGWLDEGSSPLKPISIRDIMERDDIFLIVCNTENILWADEFLYKKGLVLMEDYADSLYIIQTMYKSISLDINKKNIWIFGAGYQGKVFYEQYKEYANVKGFLSTYPQQEQYCGLPVIRPEEYCMDSQNFVVICCDCADEIGVILGGMGGKPFSHWCVRQAYPKKLFMSVGCCQERDVTMAMFRFKAAKVFYRSLDLTESFVCYMNYNARVRFLAYGNCCDVLFYEYANSWSTDDISYEKIISKRYKEAYKIKMPQYNFMGQHPQAVKAIHKYTLKSDDYIWFRGDEIVNGLIEKGMAKEDILKEISRADYWTEEFLEKNIKTELKKVEIMDRSSSLKLLSVIQKEYKNRLLFRDGIHFSAWLEVQLADQIMHLLNLPAANTEDKQKVLEQGNKKECILPPYPCIAKYLGWKNEDGITWEYLLLSGRQEKLPFKEIMGRYIDYIMEVRKIYNTDGAVII